MPKHTGKRATARRNIPRYTQIRQALEAEILSGAWPPGHRVPSEHQLLRRYRCSRMTVNKALSALAESGMIVRRRRWGSFVSSPTGRNVLQIHDIEQDVLRSGAAYRVELRARTERRASKYETELLRADSGTAVLFLRCVHFVDESPWMLEERLINLAAVPTARDADFSKRSPGSWLLDEVPWSQADHEIRSVNASRDVARLLKIKEGFACLVIERRTAHAGKTITHVVLHYPGDRHKLTASFNPTSVADRKDANRG